MRRLILLLISLISTTVFAEPQYVAIFDGGSSGTRLHLYQNNPAPLSLPNITEIKIPDNKIKPGIASINNSSQAIGAYLAPLIKQLDKTLKQHAIARTNVIVNFYATAGMRALPHPEQKSIYDHVRDSLINQGYLVNETKTLRGWQEGAYGWLAVNYLTKQLQKHQPSFGFMDMGGMSTQLVFEIENANKLPNIHLVRLGQEDYYLYAKSYLGLGLNAVEHLTTDVPSCYLNGYVLENGSLAHGNGTLCSRHLHHLIQTYSIPNLIHHITKQKFIATSGFAYVTHDLNLGNSISIHSLNKATHDYCQQNWDKVKTKNPENPYAYINCERGAYLTTLLQDYGFPDTMPIITKNEISGMDVSWTLGADLYYSQNTHYEK